MIPFLSAILLAATAAASPALAGPPGSSRLQVLTFNAGLLRPLGVNLVPCVKQRLPAQIRELDRLLHAPFVLLLQEVWTSDAQDAYAAWARSRGYFYAASSPGDNGLVTITSEPVTRSSFHEFEQNDHGAHHGILEVWLSSQGRSLRILSTQTSFSGLDGPSPIHLSQLASIASLSRASEALTLFGGDLNSGPDLSFDSRRYDPVRELWDVFVDKIGSHWSWTGRSAHAGAVTWDEARNPLVFEPSHPLRYLGVLDSRGHWGYSSSELDHVFVSPGFVVESAEVVLNQAVPVSHCNREAVPGSGKTFLSDHYGWQARLRFEASTSGAATN